jgi:FdhD protein
MKREFEIKEFRAGKTTRKSDFVAVEKNMEMTLNGETRISFSISPCELREFAYGFLFTSGFITSENDVEELYVGKEKIAVILEQKRDLGGILSLGSSGGRYIEFTADREKKPFQVKLVPDFEKLFSLFEEFAGKSIIFARTGGVHSAAISDGHSIKFFSEDIGRHNAVDKVIGKAFLEKIDFSGHFLLLSGRISSEMVKKSFYAGLSTIISRAAPTSLAIESAIEKNMSLIGFLRGKRFNIYI